MSLLKPLFLISFLIAGCAQTPLVTPPNDYAGVQVSLHAAMNRVDKQRESTRSAQESANLDQSIMTVIWEGEGAEILSRIATAKKLKFKITGPQPRLQLPVFVHLKNVTLKEAVQAIGEQFGGRADAVLSDEGIELQMHLY